MGKPFKLVELQALVRRALEKKDLLDQNKKLVEEQQVLIEKLLGANKELKKLDRLKSDFVSNVSHELRTPLTSLRNILYNLHHGIGGALTEKQRDYLKMMEEDTQRLGNLINDILDLSRLESGTLHLKRSPFVFQEALQESLKLFEGERNLRHHQFFIEISGGGENLIVDADRAKIEQVLVNLISNAVKYSGEGTRVWIQAAREGGRFRVSVKDEGLGIPAEDQERIFNRFEQLEKMARGGIKGTGLGLAIVKKILELHGEGIRVESAPGKGSTFIFELPMTKVKNDAVIN
jgi:signal transduction histidine kinase